MQEKEERAEEPKLEISQAKEHQPFCLLRQNLQSDLLGWKEIHKNLRQKHG